MSKCARDDYSLTFRLSQVSFAYTNVETSTKRSGFATNGGCWVKISLVWTRCNWQTISGREKWIHRMWLIFPNWCSHVRDCFCLIISVLLLLFPNRSESKLSGSIQWVFLPGRTSLTKMSLRKDSRPASAGSVRWNLSDWSLDMIRKGMWLRATKGGLSFGRDMLPDPVLTLFSRIGQVSRWEGWSLQDFDPVFWRMVLSRTRAGFSVASDSRSQQSMLASKTGMGKVLLLLSFRFVLWWLLFRESIWNDGNVFLVFWTQNITSLHPPFYLQNNLFFPHSKQHSKQGFRLSMQAHVSGH